MPAAAVPGTDVRRRNSPRRWMRPQSADAPRLLLISDHLTQYEILVSAAKPNASVVIVRYDDWSIEDLKNAVMATANSPKRQYNSVAIMDHGQPGCFCLLKQVAGGSVRLTDIQGNAELQAFFRFLAGFVQTPREPHNWRQDLHARIDLLSCSVAGSDEGLELVTYLEDLTHVSWAASSAKVGNASEDCDWIMDSKQGLPSVHQYYFDESRLAEWRGECLFFVPLVVAAAVVSASVAAPQTTSEVLNAVSAPVNNFVHDVGRELVGSKKLKVRNDTAIPILVAYSNPTGQGIEGPSGAVQPGSCSNVTERLVTCCVWVSADGKTWHYDHYCAPDAGVTKIVSAKEVFRSNRPTMNFVGFSVQNLAESLRDMTAEFAKKAVQAIQEIFWAAVEKFKALGDRILQELKNKFNELMDGSTGKAELAREKKKTTLEKYRKSKDGMTVFEGFFDRQDAGKTDLAGSLHERVHQLRVKAEDVRFCLMDVYITFDDTNELLSTLQHVRDDAKSLAGALKTGRNALQLIKFGGGGPIGTVLDSIKETVQKVLKGVEESSNTFSKMMDDMDRNSILPSMRKKVKLYQDKFRKNVPFDFLEESNHKLAWMEKQAQELARRYPHFKKELSDESACLALDSGINASSVTVDAASRAIEPVARVMVNARKPVDVMHSVANEKRRLRNQIKGPLAIIDKVKEVLDKLFDKLVKPILELPIVKDVLEFVSDITKKLVEWVLKATGLDKLVDWLKKNLNPFSAIQQQVQPLLKPEANLDSFVEFDDVNKARGALALLQQIDIVNLDAPHFSQHQRSSAARAGACRPATPGQVQRAVRTSRSELKRMS